VLSLRKLLDRLPAHRRTAEQTQETTERVTYAIQRYHSLEQVLKDEIERNHIAKKLIYDRGK
jgi:hypothetical protein